MLKLQLLNSSLRSATHVAARRIHRGPMRVRAACTHRWFTERQPQRRDVTARARFGRTAARYNRPETAKEAVERGLDAFQASNVDDAIEYFTIATTLNPNKEEAMAAYYNLGCAYTKNRQYDLAVDCIMRAVNDFDMKLLVALKDPDLKALRERREWVDKLPDMKGALSRTARINLRAEAKAPFRFSRLLIIGSLTAGASLGLLIIIGRLISALKGGPGAPPLQEAIENLAVNTGAVAVLGTILWYDLRGKQKDAKIVLREEDLARLQVEVGRTRVVPLLKLRGFCRPFILAGGKTYVDRALKAARPYEQELRARGVTLVPVVFANEEAGRRRLREIQEELRASSRTTGFGSLEAPPASMSGSLAVAEAPEAGKGNLERLENNPAAEVVMRESQRRLMYPAHDVPEWKDWIDEQKEVAQLPKVQQNCYVQVGLDGRVAGSGLGAPDWLRVIEGLPPLDDFRTTLTDGIVGDG